MQANGLALLLYNSTEYVYVLVLNSRHIILETIVMILLALHSFTTEIIHLIEIARTIIVPPTETPHDCFLIPLSPVQCQLDISPSILDCNIVSSIKDICVISFD